jgi:hypothetical protein
VVNRSAGSFHHLGISTGNGPHSAASRCFSPLSWLFGNTGNIAGAGYGAF